METRKARVNNKKYTSSVTDQKLSYEAERRFNKLAPQFNYLLPELIDMIDLDTKTIEKELTKSAKKVLLSNFYKTQYKKEWRNKTAKDFNSRFEFVVPQRPLKYTLQQKDSAVNGFGLIGSTMNNNTRGCCYDGLGEVRIELPLTAHSWNDRVLLHEIAHIGTDGHRKDFRDKLLELTGFFRSHAYQELLFRSYLEENASVSAVRHSEKCVEEMRNTYEGFVGIDFDQVLIAKSCTYKTNRSKSYTERVVWQSATRWAGKYFTKISKEEIEKYKAIRKERNE